MKKFILGMLLTIMVLAAINASNQKIYTQADNQWQIVNQLCHVAGVAGPSVTTPVSTEELKVALKRIDTEKLDDAGKELYMQIKRQLDDIPSIFKGDGGSFYFDAPVSFYAYGQTSTKGDAVRDLDWAIMDYDSRPDMVSLTAEVGLYDTLYGKIDWGIKPIMDASGWNKNFYTSFDGDTLSDASPKEAYISLGNNFISFIIGRSRMNYGSGYSGNMFIGDNFDYQELMKLSFFNKYYTGSISLTHFDQQADGDDSMDFVASTFSNKHQIRLANTHTVTLFNRISVSFMLGTMLQTDSAFDFRMFNPFMYFHNMNNFSKDTIFEANNFVTLDIAYTFLPHWTITGQAIVDQAQTKGEIEYFDYHGNLEPNAWGALINLSYSDIIGNGLLNVYLEGAYTSPALYLNTKYIDENGNIYEHNTKVDNSIGNKYTWNQDLIVGYWRKKGVHDIGYSGYKHGPDSAVLCLGATYQIPTGLTLKTELLYKAHGTYGIAYYESQDPTFVDLMGKENINRWSLWNEIVEHTLQCTVECEYAAYDGVELYGGIGFVNKWNYQNITGKTFTDLQLAVGVRLKPGMLIKSFL